MSVGTRRVSTTYMIITALLIGAALFIVLWILGYISFSDLYANFLFLVFQIITISILAIIGGIFVGMIFTHRILTTHDLSPIEIAIMEDHENIKYMKEKLEEMEKRLEEIEQELGKE